VDAPVHVPFGMVHELMHKSVVQLVVSDRVVTIDLGSVFDIVQDFILAQHSGAETVQDWDGMRIVQEQYPLFDCLSTAI
jgi:hypothetical protein